MAITDKVSKNELARLWDFNPKTISVILDTFRVEWKQNLRKPPFFWGGTILRRLPLRGKDKIKRGNEEFRNWDVKGNDAKSSKPLN